MPYDENFNYDPRIHVTPGAGDDALAVRFFIDAVEDTRATALAGRPIFKDAEWIEIRNPGPRADGVMRVARPADIQRFPHHYAAFKARVGDEEQIVGTPLSTWPWSGMTRARVEELKFFRVRTVEQLAAMSDSAGQQLMGFQQMKQAAQQYLDSVKTTAPIARLQAQLEQAMDKLAEQGLELARLQARSQNRPEPKATEVMVPIRDQIKREMAAIEYVKPEAEVIDMAKRKGKPKPKPRRPPGY